MQGWLRRIPGLIRCRCGWEWGGSGRSRDTVLVSYRTVLRSRGWKENEPHFSRRTRGMGRPAVPDCGSRNVDRFWSTLTGAGIYIVVVLVGWQVGENQDCAGSIGPGNRRREGERPPIVAVLFDGGTALGWVLPLHRISWVCGPTVCTNVRATGGWPTLRLLSCHVVLPFEWPGHASIEGACPWLES